MSDVSHSDASSKVYEEIKLLFSTLNKRASRRSEFVIELSYHDFLESDESFRKSFVRNTVTKLDRKLGPLLDQILGRANSALLKCEKRHRKSQNYVYPPIGFPEIERQHIELHNEVALVRTFTVESPSNPDNWAFCHRRISRMLELESKFISECWTQIEKFDKYRNDVIRYYLSIVGLVVTFVIFILVNSPKAYENGKCLYRYILGSNECQWHI